MYRIGISIVVGALFAVGAAAQSQAPAQAGAQAGGQASVQTGNTQAVAGASSSTSAATAQDGQANAGLANGTTFNAELSSPVDSKKCKPAMQSMGARPKPSSLKARPVIP